MRTMTLAISSAESDVSACDCFMTHRTTRARRPHAACTPDERARAGRMPRAQRMNARAPAPAHNGRCMDRWALHGTWEG
jgi:hypothetical protein